MISNQISPKEEHSKNNSFNSSYIGGQKSSTTSKTHQPIKPNGLHSVGTMLENAINSSLSTSPISVLTTSSSSSHSGLNGNEQNQKLQENELNNSDLNMGSKYNGARLMQDNLASAFFKQDNNNLQQSHFMKNMSMNSSTSKFKS